jgi:hypothetical protein
MAARHPIPWKYAMIRSSDPERDSRPSAGTGIMPIPVTGAALKYGNIEAWLNIIQSYRERHPAHEVHVLYKGERVHNLIDLFKIEGTPDRAAFALDVVIPDGDRKDLPKLRRLLAEGSGENYGRYIGKPLYQVLRLF